MTENSEPILNDPRNPLVSITIHNYNYGRFLRECFESVFNQTYQNIEICFSDNCSSDNSWEIALTYATRYPGRMTITLNRKNFGSDANIANCLLNVRGKYLVQLCSDDGLLPDYVRECVAALERNPHAGFALVHRTVIDEKGRKTEEPSFYNRSCLIPGAEQAAVYMMAAVNPSISQVMYNRRMTQGKSTVGGIAARWYGTRILDFNMCCEFPLVYLKKPLVMHRLHTQNDSTHAAENLMEIIGPYVLQHQYAEIATQCNLTGVASRLPKALEKLSQLCLRYCIRFLSSGDVRCAQRYFHLSTAIFPEIAADAFYAKLAEYWAAGSRRKSKIVAELESLRNVVTRGVSYDPPPGSIPLDEE